MQRKTYTVSEITSDIKILLEEKFPFIWVSGEISNFSIPYSGHYYFTLKDSKSQISGVIFKGQNRSLEFVPENGMKITGFGRISVYEPRGTYQIIFEYLEPHGTGALQKAFEQLKNRLASEGLFDEKHKAPLPFLPKKIGIVTSPGGAVVHDILKIIDRRFPNIHIEIMPSRVQGSGAEKEVAAAIKLLNARHENKPADLIPDLIIVARGGGSLEDLAAFNSEDVARAVFASKIPVISAVGHETDYTICDFTADLRAPTPSAAAELAVPQKDELEKKCSDLLRSLKTDFYKYIEQKLTILKSLSNRLVDPGKKLTDLRLRIDDITSRLVGNFLNHLKQKRKDLAWRIEILQANTPLKSIPLLNERLEQINSDLLSFLKIYLISKRAILNELSARLKAVNPEAILARGYSITRTIPERIIVKETTSVAIDDKLEIMVRNGLILCRVEGKIDNGETNI
ncbi:MAG: exodeoxyribonuclease VII large subunit [Deltaproteobacteria bacterium]|nr:exodeoxyribonuclease VII large subunit [Deltaproteobacteria bacterium]